MQETKMTLFSRVADMLWFTRRWTAGRRASFYNKEYSASPSWGMTSRHPEEHSITPYCLRSWSSWPWLYWLLDHPYCFLKGLSCLFWDLGNWFGKRFENMSLTKSACSLCFCGPSWHHRTQWRCSVSVGHMLTTQWKEITIPVVIDLSSTTTLSTLSRILELTTSSTVKQGVVPHIVNVWRTNFSQRVSTTEKSDVRSQCWQTWSHQTDSRTVYWRFWYKNTPCQLSHFEIHCSISLDRKSNHCNVHISAVDKGVLIRHCFGSFANWLWGILN